MSFTKIFENIVELAKENLELKETIIKQNELIIEDKLELIKKHKEIREIKNGMVVKNRHNKAIKARLHNLCIIVKNTRYDGTADYLGGIRKAKKYVNSMENANMSKSDETYLRLFYKYQGFLPFSQSFQGKFAPSLPPAPFVRGNDPKSWDDEAKRWDDDFKCWLDYSKRWDDDLECWVNERKCNVNGANK